MDILLIKKISLSTIILSLNILLPTKVLALTETNHQIDRYTNTSSINQHSTQSISSPVFENDDEPPYKPPNNGGPPEDASTGAGSR